MDKVELIIRLSTHLGSLLLAIVVLVEDVQRVHGFVHCSMLRHNPLDMFASQISDDS